VGDRTARRPSGAGAGARELVERELRSQEDRDDGVRDVQPVPRLVPQLRADRAVAAVADQQHPDDGRPATDRFAALLEG
jgi:hypothetical protein